MNRRFSRRSRPSRKSHGFGVIDRAEKRPSQRGTWREHLGSLFVGSTGSRLVDWFRGLVSSGGSTRGAAKAIGADRPLGHFEPLEARQLLAGMDDFVDRTDLSAESLGTECSSKRGLQNGVGFLQETAGLIVSL